MISSISSTHSLWSSTQDGSSLVANSPLPWRKPWKYLVAGNFLKTFHLSCMFFYKHTSIHAYHYNYHYHYVPLSPIYIFQNFPYSPGATPSFLGRFLDPGKPYWISVATRDSHPMLLPSCPVGAAATPTSRDQQLFLVSQLLQQAGPCLQQDYQLGPHQSSNKTNLSLTPNLGSGNTTHPRSLCIFAPEIWLILGETWVLTPNRATKMLETP